MVAMRIIGLEGRFPILWDPTMVVLEHLLYSPSFLTIQYRIIDSQDREIIINVYGPINQISKGPFLDSLKNIKNLVMDKPWIVGGHINIIASLHEKNSGH
jgi:hypothetical protein